MGVCLSEPSSIFISIEKHPIVICFSLLKIRDYRGGLSDPSSTFILSESTPL